MRETGGAVPFLVPLACEFVAPRWVSVRVVGQFDDNEGSVVWDGLCGLVDAVGGVELVEAAHAHADSGDLDGERRQDLAFDELSFDDWWANWRMESTTFRVRIAGGWSLQVFAIRSSERRTVHLDFDWDGGGDLYPLLDAVRDLARRVEVVGFVGLGRAWAQSLFGRGSQIAGYGPMVVARRDVLDLSVADRALMDSLSLDGDRELLVARPGAPLVDAVEVIRNVCWPAIGLQGPARPDPSLVYFEGTLPGSTLSINVIGPMLSNSRSAVLDQALTDEDRDPIGESTIVVSASADTSKQRALRITHLNEIARFWERAATFTQAAQDSERAGVQAAVIDCGSNVEIVLRNCGRFARDLWLHPRVPAALNMAGYHCESMVLTDGASQS